MKKVVIVIFLFLILGALYGYQRFFNVEQEGDDKDGPQNLKTRLIVADQKPMQSILISQAFLDEDGFVVIYDEKAGKPLNVIGNSKTLPPGESINTNIGLTRPSVEGETLFAVLHYDNGDGAFNPLIDIPARDEENNIIFAVFRITRNAP